MLFVRLSMHLLIQSRNHTDWMATVRSLQVDIDQGTSYPPRQNWDCTLLPSSHSGCTRYHHTNQRVRWRAGETKMSVDGSTFFLFFHNWAIQNRHFLLQILLEYTDYHTVCSTSNQQCKRRLLPNRTGGFSTITIIIILQQLIHGLVKTNWKTKI